MTIQHAPLLLCLLAATSLHPWSSASAQETPPQSPAPQVQLGERHQLVFSADGSMTLQRRTQSNSDGAVTTVSIAPAVDFFILRRLSIGAFANIEYSRTGDNHASRISAGPRAGYALSLGERWRVWPRAGVSFAFTDTSLGDSQNAIALNVFVPFVYQPNAQFFAGVGPFLDTDLNGDNRATVWGAKITVGGWL
jgi:hypothetical protein